MQTASKIILALVLSLAFVAPAVARGRSLSPQARRSAVSKYRKARNLNGKFRMRSVRRSLSGKSTHVAVATAGKTSLLTVNNRSGRVAHYANTGLVKQSTARGKAHRLARRERGSKGAFSGVYKSGLSNSGKSYKFTSKTDRNERIYVNVRNGKTRRYDNTRRTRLNKMAIGLR